MKKSLKIIAWIIGGLFFTGVAYGITTQTFQNPVPIINGGTGAITSSTALTNLGITDTGTLASSTWLKVANNLSDGTVATMRTNLGLGTLATANSVAYASTTGVQATLSFPLPAASSTGLMVIANNGSDINSTSTFRTNLGLNEKCDISFMIENASSSSSALDNNGDSFPTPFPYNATITKVKAWNTEASQLANFNLSYNSSAIAATSTFRLFTANKSLSNTSTTIYTSFASSTPNANDILRVNFGNTSSSQFSVNVCYTQN